MNILLCYDDMTWDYTRHAAVTILSLLATNKWDEIKIFIMTSFLKQENIDELKRIVGLYNQEIEFIIEDNIIPEDIKKAIIKKNSKQLLTLGARYYFFFPKYIEWIDRILYLDCDIIVMKDISDIYNMNMHWKTIVWYYDRFNLYSRRKKAFWMKNYINSWVLLFDVKKYNSNKINAKKIEELEVKYWKYDSGQDEEKVNLIFRNEIFVWKRWMNYQISNKFFNKWISDAEIVHCMQKPYIQYSWIPQKFVKIYYDYLSLTKWKWFPERKAGYWYVHHMCNCIRHFTENLLLRIIAQIEWDNYY